MNHVIFWFKPSRMKYAGYGTRFRNPASRHRIARKNQRLRGRKTVSVTIPQSMYIRLMEIPPQDAKTGTDEMPDADEPE